MRFHLAINCLLTNSLLINSLPRAWRLRRALHAPRSLQASMLLLALMVAACGGAAENEAAPATAAPVATVASTVVPTVAPNVAPTDAPAVAPTEVAAPEAATTAPQRFQIDPTQSEARFIVDEVLFGSPNTVTGVTSGVAGAIEINVADPSQTTISAIQIDARTLVTDNRFRNRSISRMILQSNQDDYQYITFTPTAIEDLPATTNVGDTFTFAVMGDLQIRDIVQPTTFEVTVTADSATQISGLAQTVVMRADFELTIPNVDGVADVTEEVRLELEFVATASE